MDGRHVGQRLAGVLDVGERVDDRHVLRVGELVERGVAVDAGDDEGAPPFEDARYVLRRLAYVQHHLIAPDVDRVAAQFVHADVERYACS